jgi:hypothetical protein
MKYWTQANSLPAANFLKQPVPMQIKNRKSKIESRQDWLPDMDLNHDKQIQSLLCYRYTIGQRRVSNLDGWPLESRLDHA